MERQNRYTHGIFIILLFFAFVLLAAILKLTASVTIPLAIAMLVSLVFEPVLYKLKHKLHIPWAAGIVIVFIIVFFILAAVTSLITTSCKTIITVYPRYEEKFLLLYSRIADLFSLPFDEENSLFENLWNQLEVKKFVQDFALSFSSKLITYTKDFVMIFLFSLFFLLELRYVRPKIDYAAELIPSTNMAATEDEQETQTIRKKKRISTIIKDIITQVTKYISVKFFISLLTGILVFITTVLLKLDFAIIWAFLAFVLNFIPNFGSILSVLGTSLFALVEFWPSPVRAILTAIFMTLINFLIGNVAEPRIQGKNLGLSPFVIIASLSLWGWLWGFAGLILGVPMTVIMKIICENFSLLKPVAVILGDWPPSQKSTN